MISKKEKSLRAANKHLQKGQVDKAIREYQKVLTYDDRDPRIRHKYAELLARKGRSQEAMEEFRWVAAYYEQGGFYPKAVAVYKQMLGMDPEKIDLHLHLGEIYRQQGKRSDAAYHFRTVAGKVEKDGAIEDKIAVYEKLCRINPDDVDLHQRLVDQYVDAGMATKAVEALSELAADLRTRGDTEQLLGTLDRLSRLAEEPLPFYREMAAVHMGRKAPRRALAKLQQCFKIDPQDEETLTMLGRAFADLGKKHKALQVFEELIRIYQSRNDTTKLREIEAEVHAIAPESRPPADAPDEGPTIPLELPEELAEDTLRAVVQGEVFLRYGLLEKAEAAAVGAVREHPSTFAAHRLHAQYLEAIEDSPGAAAAVMQMYTVAMDAGDLPVARRCLVETVRLLPDDPGAEGRVSAFDEAMGEQLRAFEQEQVLELSDEIRTPMAVDASGEVSIANMPVSGGGVPASMDPDVESLDGESVEILPDEQLLSELAMGPAAAAAAAAPQAPEDSDEIELEVSDDESTLASPEGAALKDSLDDDPDTIDDEVPLDREPSATDADFDSLLDEMADVIGGVTDEPTAAEGADTALGGGSPGLDLGLGYYEVGLYAEALRELEGVIGEGVDDARARLYIGRCRIKLGQVASAVEDLRLGLDAGPAPEIEAELLFELGAGYEAQGEARVAHDTFADLAQRAPDHRPADVAERVSELAARLAEE